MVKVLNFQTPDISLNTLIVCLFGLTVVKFFLKVQRKCQTLHLFSMLLEEQSDLGLKYVLSTFHH